MQRILAIICASALLFLVSCEGDYIPKPRAYPRVSFPQKQYMAFESDCPFSFQFPTYARISPDQEGDEALCWMNVEYMPFNAKLHLSYKPLIQEADLEHLIEDAYMFVQKHNVKANMIDETLINNGTGSGGLYYSLGGNTATSVQFFMTDSTSHFLRGSLYFQCKPNHDSLAPIISFLEKDIERLVQTLRWKAKM